MSNGSSQIIKRRTYEMKVWNAPVMESLEINETAKGGRKVSEHDGFINYSHNGLPAEEYASGPVAK